MPVREVCPRRGSKGASGIGDIICPTILTVQGAFGVADRELCTDGKHWAV
jgi:hypothetical protein